MDRPHHPIDRPQHPSGRPIACEREGVVSQPRIPSDGPLTPRLQPGHDRVEAIGFHVDVPTDDDEDDEYEQGREPSGP